MSRSRAAIQVNLWSGTRYILAIFVALLLIYLVAPVFIVIPMAMSPGRYMVFPPPSLSFRWFEEFFSSHAWLSATFLSIRVALLATLIATALGTVAAFGIVGPRFRGKNLVYVDHTEGCSAPKPDASR